MIKVEPQRIQAMATRKDPIPQFMKHAGSIQGPADLSSRRGFSRGVEDKVVADKIVAEKTQFKRAKKSRRGKTRQAASLQ
jgi:hypothetical protein